MAELRELTYPVLAAAQAIADLLPIPDTGPSVPGARMGGRTTPATAAVEPIPSGAAYALFLTEGQASFYPSVRGTSTAEVPRIVPDPGARIRDELPEVAGARLRGTARAHPR